MLRNENNEPQNPMSNIEHITFGVELETTIPATCPIRVGSHGMGIAIASAPHFNGGAWKADADPSIVSDRITTKPCEFVSPILKGEAGVLHLIEFVEWLHSIGAKVNGSTGCHVHIGVAPFSTSPEHQARFVKILARLVTRNAVALYAQTGTTSREMGRWCPRAGTDVRKAITRACRAKSPSSVGVSRYQLLNLMPISSKGTVEFRCFAGTLNISKLLAHLLSVFSLVITADKRKSLTAWDPREVLTGTQALHNLLRARPAFSIVGAAVFSSRKREILAKAFEMAARYDQSRNGAAPQGGGAMD